MRAVSLLLPVLALAMLPNCLADGTDGTGEVDEMEDDRAAEATSWGAPDPTKWKKVFTEDFPQDGTLAKWSNPGRDINSCAELKDGKLYVPPNDRSCRVASIQHFGEGADANKAYVFAASVRLAKTTGHFGSFWVTSAAVDPRTTAENVNEIDIIESFGKVDRDSRQCGDATVISTDGPGFYGVQNVFYSQFKTETHPKAGRIHCFSQNQVNNLNPYDGKFHVYAVEWWPGDHLTYTMDGKKTAEFGAQYASNQAVSIVLTNILGDDGVAGIKGTGSRNFEVAWVRAWRRR